MIVFPENHLWGIDVAIKKLRPGASFTLSGAEFIDWEDPSNLPPPTWEEIHNQVLSDKESAEEWLKNNNIEG